MFNTGPGALRTVLVHVYTALMKSDREPVSPVVVQRILSPAQAAARTALIDAAIELATEGGYNAVDMREVAKRAGMSVAKAYQQVGTKDQLLLSALMELGERSGETVHQRLSAGDTPADRVASTFARIMKHVAHKPLLYRAVYRAYVASSPALGELVGSAGFGPERTGWIGEAMRAGDLHGHSEEDMNSAARILSCLFQGAMVTVAAGRDVDDVTSLLADAAHRLLPNP